MADKASDAQEKKEIKNTVKITEAGPCRKKVAIKVPAEAIAAALDEQYKELGHDAIVPGFRKGRAPRRLLEKRFGKDVNTQTKLKLLSDASEAAIKDNELKSLGEPDIDHENVEMPDEGAMKFEFELEVRPEFELCKLEGIAVDKPKLQVTDELIDKEVEAIQQRFGVWVPKEKGAVALDEQIIADVLLKPDEGEEETVENTEIFVRPTGFVGRVSVEKLDKLLVGSKTGDVKKTTVDVPKTFFNEAYRGKKVDLEITVKDVKKMVPAELDKAFFEKLGMEDVKELRKKISEHMQQQIEQEARSAMRDGVHKHLLSNIEFELPENIVAEQSEQIFQRQQSRLMMSGLARDQLDEQMEKLRSGSEDQAKEQLKTFFIMDKIAEKLKIETTEEEINGHIAQAAMQRGTRPEKMREQMLRDGSLAQFTLEIRQQKCVDKLLESAKITEVKPKAEPKAKPKATKKAVKKKATPKTPKEATAKSGTKSSTKKATAKKVTPKKKSTKPK